MRRSICVILLTLFFITSCGRNPDPGDVSTAPTATRTASSQSTGAGDVLFWHPFHTDSSEYVILQKLINEFNSSHLQTQIISQPIGSCDALFNAIDESIDQTLPGLALVCSGGDTVFFEKTGAVPIQAILGEEAQPLLADILPAYLQSTSTNGQTFALPFTVSAPLLFYNMDMAQAYGIEQTGMKDTLQGVLDAAYLIYDYEEVRGLSLALDPAWLFETIAASDGKIILDENGKIIPFERSTMDILDALSRMAANDVVEYSRSQTNTANKLLNGNLGMALLPGEWGEVFKGNDLIGVMEWPGLAGIRTSPSLSATSFYVLTGDQLKQQTIAEFILYLTAQEQLTRFVEQSSYLPARMSVLETERSVMESNPVLRASISSLDAGNPRIDYALDSIYMKDVFQKAIDGILSGETDADEALTEVYLKLEEQLGD